MRPTIQLQLLAFLACSFCFTACEKAIFVEIPDEPPELVVSGFFSPDSLWQIDLSNSVTYTSFNSPTPVSDAAVEIWAGEFLVDRLRSLGNGRYRSHRRPVVDREYTLRVTANGFTPVEAKGVVPRPVLDAFARTLPAEVNQFGGLAVPVELTFADPPGAGDYYALSTGVRVIVQPGGSGEQFTFSGPTSFTSRDLVFREDDVLDTEESWYERALFNDDVVEGRSNTVNFTVLIFDGSLPPDITQIFVEVYLRSVSEDFYLHAKTVQLQDEFGDSPFSEPIQIHSNTSNGFGVFAGYRTRKLSIPIELAR